MVYELLYSNLELRQFFQIQSLGHVRVKFIRILIPDSGLTDVQWIELKRKKYIILCLPACTTVACTAFFE